VDVCVQLDGSCAVDYVIHPSQQLLPVSLAQAQPRVAQVPLHCHHLLKGAVSTSCHLLVKHPEQASAKHLLDPLLRCLGLLATYQQVNFFHLHRDVIVGIIVRTCPERETGG
jgi:hypothetical protein